MPTFDPGINPSDAEISKFFSENAFRYTVPPRVSVDFVEFPAEAFMAQNAPTDAEVREYYDANPAQVPEARRPRRRRRPSPIPAADFKAVQPQVRAALQRERAKTQRGQGGVRLRLRPLRGQGHPGPLA